MLGVKVVGSPVLDVHILIVCRVLKWSRHPVRPRYLLIMKFTTFGHGTQIKCHHRRASSDRITGLALAIRRSHEQYMHICALTLLPR